MQKKYIIIVSILVVYVIAMVLIFGLKKETITSDTYLVIGDNTRWEYVDKEWSNLDIQDKEFDSREFEVYKDQIYQGKFYLQNYNDTWYFFDKNNKSYDLYGQLFAYSSENKIDVIKFNLEEPSVEEINDLLEKYDIEVSSLAELSKYQKISYNFDNDEALETIYSISNLMIDDIEGVTFSLVLYEDEKKTYEIINKTDDVEYVYDVSNIIDFNLDKKYEIIIEQQKPMDPTMNCHSMYKLKKGKYELLKSCG